MAASYGKIYVPSSATSFGNSFTFIYYLFNNDIMGEGRNVYRVLAGKPEGKRPLGKPTRRWKDGIKMDITDIGWGVCSGFTWLRIGIAGGLL
jgi:hypothetical protein